MTEQYIRDVAEMFGLKVDKRITTGTEREGFATFELSGEPEKVLAAWPDLSGKDGRGPAFCYVRRSDADGKNYIGIESVWFSEGKP